MLLLTVTGLALVGSVLVSYARARAESLNIACKVGFLERPERLVLLIIGSLTATGDPSNPFLHKMPQVLWVLAVLSHWTVVHRIYHTWLQSRAPDRAALVAAAEETEPESSQNLFWGLSSRTEAIADFEPQNVGKRRGLILFDRSTAALGDRATFMMLCPSG